jgi:hypothetical protein
MQDVANVAFDLDWFVNVGLSELEVGVSLQGAEVVRRAGEEVVQSEDAIPLFEECLTKVRADETCSARDDGSRLATVTRGRYPDT